MNTPSSKEVLHTPRHNALIVLLIGFVFLGIGLWAVTTMWGRGERVFVWIWGSIWFLGSGAAFVNGLMGLLKPPVYAVLSADGLALPPLRVTQIPWSHIRDVRLAPKKMTDSEGTHYVFKEPLILRLRDLTPLQTGKAARWTQGMTSPLGDGTFEFMVQTQSCPLPANAFLARIQSRLLGETVPVLPVTALTEAAAFGGRPINQPIRKSKFTAAFACIFVAVGLLFAGHGIRAIIKGRASLHWPNASGRVICSSIETDSDNDSRFNIRYTYDVGGHTYTGQRLAFVTSIKDNGAYLRQYSAGASVRVYYQPDQHETAVIIPGSSGGLFVVGFGLIFSAVGAWLVWSNLRSR